MDGVCTAHATYIGRKGLLINQIKLTVGGRINVQRACSLGNKIGIDQ